MYETWDSYHDGYGSDRNPFYDAVFDELSGSEYQEESPTDIPFTHMPTPVVPNDCEQAEPFPSLDEDTGPANGEPRKWKVTQNGAKLVLQSRLLALLSAGFAEEAVWKELQRKDSAVWEPSSKPKKQWFWKLWKQSNLNFLWNAS